MKYSICLKLGLVSILLIASLVAAMTTTLGGVKAGTKAERARIKVKEPNGAEVWLRGNKVVVKWKSNELTGDKVRIELLRSNGFCTLIAGRTANDGKLKWIVPSHLDPDSDYAVRVIAMDDPNTQDRSDSDFSVVGLGLRRLK